MPAGRQRITACPTNEQLSDSLLNGTEVDFEIEGTTVVSGRVQAMEREDGSGKSWNLSVAFEGSATPLRQIHCQTEHGVGTVHLEFHSSSGQGRKSHNMESVH